MTKELLQQALDALLPHGSSYGNGKRPVEDAAIEGLTQALAQQEQPEQEASATWTEMVVANLVREGVNKHRARELAAHFLTLPTQPALSDDEILNCFYASKSEGMASYMLAACKRAIEAHCRGGANK